MPRRPCSPGARSQRCCGWQLMTIHEDAGLSGKSLNRAGLADALALVEGGEASAIIVAKLGRLSRSLVLSASARGAGSSGGLCEAHLGLASHLRIEERELEAGGLTQTRVCARRSFFSRQFASSSASQRKWLRASSVCDSGSGVLTPTVVASPRGLVLKCTFP